MSNPTTPQEIIANKPYLAWYVKNHEDLSNKSVLEHVLNYGDWNDVQQLINLMGINQAAALFKEVKNQKRNNLLPKIEYYFTLYFAKHAKTNSF